MGQEKVTASVIFAAGKGSRMKGTEANKTLLPLRPGTSLFEGERPILLEILENLPSGPKAMVVNYKKEEVIKNTRSLNLHYYVQPVLNGTGGALIAAKAFIQEHDFDQLIITYGDIPLVKSITYRRLLGTLDKNDFSVLGFKPEDKKQYGVLEIENDRVKKITDSKYWQNYPTAIQKKLSICNAGIYATKKEILQKYLPILEQHPHKILKERKGKMVEIEEYFLTDLIEWMDQDGLNVGYTLAENEYEVMGVDDPTRLEKAQQIYKELYGQV